jgi:hypothetical protein
MILIGHGVHQSCPQSGATPLAAVVIRTYSSRIHLSMMSSDFTI